MVNHYAARERHSGESGVGNRGAGLPPCTDRRQTDCKDIQAALKLARELQEIDRALKPELCHDFEGHRRLGSGTAWRCGSCLNLRIKSRTRPYESGTSSYLIDSNPESFQPT